MYPLIVYSNFLLVPNPCIALYFGIALPFTRTGCHLQKKNQKSPICRMSMSYWTHSLFDPEHGVRTHRPVHFAAFCKEWLAVAKKYNHVTQCWRKALPMLIIPSETEGKRRLYSISEGKSTTTLSYHSTHRRITERGVVVLVGTIAGWQQ